MGDTIGLQNRGRINLEEKKRNPIFITGNVAGLEQPFYTELWPCPKAHVKDTPFNVASSAFHPDRIFVTPLFITLTLTLTLTIIPLTPRRG